MLSVFKLKPMATDHRLRLAAVFYAALRMLLLALVAMASPSGHAAGTWTLLANPHPPSGQHMMLLSDGTVIFLGQPCSRLTPDIHGSYVNGTWTTLAPMHDSRTYYSSQVLPDGRVFVAGGEYGSGATKAEIYQPTNNTWTQVATPPDTIIDNISETLPNGNILEGSPGSDIRIYDIVSNIWSAKITPFGGQDEASWVKLQDGSVLTFTGTNSERFIPALNQWVVDTDLPAPLYGWGYELGNGILLPTGQAVFFGGTGTNALYTPWTTNYAGIYTPNGATNAGTWTIVAPTPNFNAPIDAPTAMMINGKILCCMTTTNNSFGSTSRFYEYDYVANAFTAINGPEGGSIANQIAYGTEMLDLPDGTVLVSGAGSGLHVYQPGGSPLTNGMPVILSATTNLDGSFHLTGTLFNGISEGAGYGDDWQMNSDYPVARLTNSSGNILYCRTYNWSTCNLMTGTNIVTTEMTLPPGMLAGTYPLFVTANGISSAPYSLTISGTPLPAVTGLAFTTIASNQMVFHWNPIGLTETAFLVQRSTDGVNYATVATLATNLTTYTDNTVTPLGQYYYLVMGTNSVGLGNAAPAIFAASPPVVALPAPWQSQDVGTVLGRGASGTNAGGFTVIGSGSGMSADNDQFQFAFQPVIGDVTITARVITNQNTGSNAMAGVMIRSSPGFDVADALMVFDGGAQSSIFEHRADAAGVATYGLEVYDQPDNEAPAGGNGGGSTTIVSQPASAPLWVRLVRSGNTLTGYTSPDGSTWTQQGTTTIIMSPVVEVGLAVTSGTYNLLNTSTFDNVTVTGTPAAIPPPMAEWKLDETSGTTAEDSIDSFDGLCNNVMLGLPGATPASGYSAGFNGTNANISIPPLNLNSNVLTITAWVNRSVNESASSGIFFNRANSTVSGLTFNSSTANELSYTWNNNSSTYGWHSALVVPSNQWTFVALVIESNRARIFMSTNGVLYSATNNVANGVQAFDGTSYLGWDSTSSTRYFKGQLDEVQFFNQALTPAQLAQMASQPGVNLASPTNGAVLPAFASLNLSVSFSATNSHSLNSVQYFSDNGQLLGASATPPFSASTTNLNTGSYAIFARLFYDAGYSVDSPLDSVIVAVQPSITNTWDANGALAGAQDGNGSWGGGSTNWWNGSADVAWTDFSLAVFGAGTTTNCIVTLTNDVTPYAITFNANTGSYTLAGTNSIWLNVPDTALNITANGNATITAPLQGDNSLVKLGAGTLTLTASNNYAGATVVSAGILKLGTNTACGSSITVTNTGTLNLNGQDFTASMFALPVTISGAGAGGTALTNSSTARAQLQDVVLSSNATIASANTIFIGGTNAVNGVLNLNGFTLTKGGSGTLLLNGLTVSGAGNITVNAGTLQLMDTYGNNQQDTSLAGSGNLTINSGASVMTYKWGSTLAVTMPVVMNGGTLGSGWPGPNGATYACPILVNTNSTFNFSGGYDSCTFSGNITGTAGLTLTGGTATRTFTGTNSYGWTTINAGVLQIGNGGASGTLGLGNVTNNSTLIFNRTGSLPVTNRISGTGALIQNGSGTVTLFGTNIFTGGTTLAAGILNVSAPETAGTSGPLGKSGTIAFIGGTLQYSLVNSIDYSSRFSTATNQDISIDTAGQSVTFATSLTSTGGGSLTKLGAGTLTLAGANTYDTTTAVGAGTLAITGSLKGVGAITVSNGAALLVKANGAAAIITNASALTLGTSGATTLTVSNFVGNANAPVNVASLTVNGPVTVNVIGLPVLGQYPLIKYAGTIGGVGYSAFALGTVPANVFVTLSNNTANASVDLVVATNTLVWSGAVNGTWDIATTANWTRGGASSVFNSNATAQFDDTASGTTAVSLNLVVSPSGVDFANSSKNYSVSGSGAISGGAALVKAGTGMVTLATTNTYTGTTTVNGGTLLVNGTLPAGAVTVATNAMLGGTGKIYGATTVLPGGTLQPGLGGTNIAILTISNSLNLSGNMLFTLNRTNVLTASKISGLGTVTYGGALTVTNLGATNFAAGDGFTLFQATNYLGSFTNATLPVLPAGLAWNTNNLVVNGTISVSNIIYTLTYNAGPNGAISGTSTQSLIYGASGTAVIAVPNIGYGFASWSDGNTSNPRTDVNVTSNLAVTANFAANPASVVVWTSPTNGASYTVPAIISLAASVTTNGNLINAVQFISNTTNLLAQVTNAPYAYAWTNVATGSYSLLARVLFNGTASNDSSAVVITVNNAVPVVPVIAAGTVAFTGGGFTLGGTGGAGQAYVLLGATNLVSPVWTPIATNVADTNGVFQFTDPGATNTLQQFYRLRSP
jgi:autotransporter-associated beta strand protein